LAGKHLGASQPTTSAELRRLRELFRDELLVYTGGRHQLTALAQRLVTPVSTILAAIDQALILRPTFDPTAEHREFSISMADYCLPLLLRPLAERLAAEAPAVAIHFHNPAQRMLKLSRGDVHLVISPTNDPSAGSFAGVRSEPLYTDRWVCVVDAAHPKVDDCMTPELFTSLPHLEIGVGSPPLFNAGERAYRAGGLDVYVPITTESFALTPLLVVGTELVAVVPEKVAHHFAARVGLKVLAPPFAAEPQVQAMYWNALTEADPAHTWLRRTLLDIADGV